MYFTRNSANFTLILLVISLRMSLECDLPNGSKGKCMEKGKCTRSKTRCETDGMVCCAVFERIVTPEFGISSPSSPIMVLPSMYPYPPMEISYPPMEISYPPMGNTQSPVEIPQSPLEIPYSTIGITPRPLEVTTKIMTPTTNWPGIPTTGNSGIAKMKCEEYKRRIKKRATITTYVFGGTESLSREFPHMAALGYGQASKVDWLCGGSLISDFYVVTAAHCLITSNLGELIRVRLGDLNLSSNSDDAQPSDYGIAQKMVHPQYHLPTQYNDIAVIKLDRQVAFSEYIAPICLQTEYHLPNYQFVATGWGRTELAPTQSDVLMKVNLDYFPVAQCRRNYAMLSPEALPVGILDMSQICAGSYTDHRDTCQGDSGGPLQIKDDVYYLVGITSFGKACGIANSPAVYTRVSYFVPWLEQTIWQL